MSVKAYNPRVGMFEALQLTAELFTPEKISTVAKFLSLSKLPTIEVSGSKSEEPRFYTVKKMTFRYYGETFVCRENQVVVRNRRTGEILVYSPGDFENIYQEYPPAADKELKRLADFLLSKYSTMIGQRITDEKGETKILETAVDLAIFLLQNSICPVYVSQTKGTEAGDISFSALALAGDAIGAKCEKCGKYFPEEHGYPAAHTCNPKNQ